MHLPKDGFAPDSLFLMKQSGIICNCCVCMRSFGFDPGWNGCVMACPIGSLVGFFGSYLNSVRSP